MYEICGVDTVLLVELLLVIYIIWCNFIYILLRFFLFFAVVYPPCSSLALPQSTPAALGIRRGTRVPRQSLASAYD